MYKVLLLSNKINNSQCQACCNFGGFRSLRRRQPQQQQQLSCISSSVDKKLLRHVLNRRKLPSSSSLLSITTSSLTTPFYVSSGWYHGQYQNATDLVLPNKRYYSTVLVSRNNHHDLFVRKQQHTERLLLPTIVRDTQIISKRYFWSSILPDIPSIWGGTGYLLKLFHNGGRDIIVDGITNTSNGIVFLPYWGCFVAIGILVRTVLLPAVVYGARTSARFAKVVPEVQFILSLFQNDLKELRSKTNPPATAKERWDLMRINMQTLSGIYKLHNIKPYAVFLSPLLQIPIFWYISVDIRKIVNGLDPALAQDLVDASIGWITDLTEPDPWYGLPILAGLAMYGNIEVAIGNRTLAGPAASKVDTAIVMKDIFQTFSIFMPCFTSQLPAGVQIYVVTSFLFTAVQSSALRNDSIRTLIGLPLMSAPPLEAKYAKQFIELKQLEQRAREMRGPGGRVLGMHGILAQGLEVSFAGSYRPSTIQGSVRDPMDSTTGTTTESNIHHDDRTDPMTLIKTATELLPKNVMEMPYIHGITAPLSQLMEQYKEQQLLEQQKVKTSALESIDNNNYINDDNDQGSPNSAKDNVYMPVFDDDIIAKANRGDRKMMVEMLMKDNVQFKIEKNDNNNKGNQVLSLKRFLNNNQKGTKKKNSGSPTKKKKR